MGNAAARPGNMSSGVGRFLARKAPFVASSSLGKYPVTHVPWVCRRWGGEWKRGLKVVVLGHVTEK